MDTKMFIICGCSRSGTTLLKSLLNSHPKIFISAETFYYDLVRKNNLYNTTCTYSEVIDLVVSKWWIKDMNLSKDSIISCLNKNDIESKADIDDLFIAIIMASYKQSDLCSTDKRVLGEKTPQHINQALRLLTTKRFKVIHILRDPRAVFASLKKSRVGSPFLTDFLNEWKTAYIRHREMSDIDGYLAIKYEDLITDSDLTISKICTLLDVDFDANVHDFYKRNDIGFSKVQTHHYKTMRPLNSDSLETWRDELSTREVKIIEHKLSDEINSLNYHTLTTSDELSISDRFYLFFIGKVALLHKVLIRKPRQIKKKYLSNRLRANK